MQEIGIYYRDIGLLDNVIEPQAMNLHRLHHQRPHKRQSADNEYSLPADTYRPTPPQFGKCPYDTVEKTWCYFLCFL
jgi:hypothetical protein